MQAESIVVIVAISLLLLYVIASVVRARTRGVVPSWIPFILMFVGVLFLILVIFGGQEIQPYHWAEVLVLIGLLLITAVYADSTARMAEEMREQRIIESRPVIIQKAVYEKDIYEGSTSNYFSHFEIYNAGNGPAIEVEIPLLNKQKDSMHSQRKTFLRAGESPIEFSPAELATLEKTNYYLVCEYQSIFSRGQQPTWYQTWLPFETIEASEKGKIYVKAGELEFKEVPENERIDAFSSRSKPK